MRAEGCALLGALQGGSTKSSTYVEGRENWIRRSWASTRLHSRSALGKAGTRRRWFSGRVSHTGFHGFILERDLSSSEHDYRWTMPSKSRGAILNTSRGRCQNSGGLSETLRKGQRPSPALSSSTRRGGAPWLANFLLYLIMLGSMISPVRWEEEHIVRKFVHSPGMHFEPLGNLKLSNRMWTFAFTVDMKPLVDRVNQVTRELDNAKKLCARTKESWGTYGLLVGRWENDFNIQKSYLQSLLAVGAVRRRRGLVDRLGAIAKSLFGTMDAEDAKHIYKELTRLENGQEKAFGSAKRQIQIVNSTVQHLQRVEAEINANEDALRKSISEVWEHIDGEFDRITVRVSLEEHMIAVEAIMNGVVEDIKGIKTLVKGKLLDSEVVPEEQLVAILRNASYPTGFSLPFSPKVNGLQELEEVSSLAVQIFKGKIIAVLKVPLVTSETFNVYAVHGIPQRLSTGVYTYLRPSNDLLVVQGATRYVKMSTSQLEECKILQGQYLCTQTLPIQVIGRQSPCEVQMYSHQGKLPETCVPEHVALTHLTLVQMRSGTAWLYVAPSPEEIIIRCDSATKRETLQDAGILQLRDFCEVETADFTIFGKQVSGTQLDLHVHPKLNITFPEEERRMLENLAIKNITKSPVGRIIQHVDELKDIQVKLGLEKEQLDKDDREWHYRPRFTQPIVLGAGIITLIIVSGCLGLCCWYNYPKLKFNRRPKTNSIEI